MLPNFPIERTCCHRDEPFQLRFARAAARLLPALEDSRFEATDRGLVLRGETEASLERPIKTLLAHYGRSIDIGAPSVRVHQGSVLEEPYMGLGVLCACEHIEAIKLDLRARDAVIFDEEISPQFGVIRATAPLTKLLGYTRHLTELGAGSASAIMWLSHYAPAKARRLGGTAA